MNTKFQKRKGYNYKREDLLTGIAIVVDTSTGAIEGKKYRNLADNPRSLERFERFILKKFPTVKEVNYYTGISHKFLRKKTF